MKMSKIFAGMSALALAVTASAVTVSANEAFMTTPQMSWSKTAPTDAVKGVVKFGGLGDDGSAKTAYGACDVNQWVTGDKYNGMWCQYTLCSNDLSSITITFTVEITDDTEWEYHHPDGPDGKNDYEILRIFAGDAMISEKISYDDAVGGVDSSTHKQNDLVKPADGAKKDTFTYTVTGADIQKALDTPSADDPSTNCAQLAQNEDGSEFYTLGFNVQTGHYYNGKLTAKITGDTLAEVDESNAAVNPNASTTSSEGGESTPDGTPSTTDGGTTDTTSDGGSTTTSSGGDGTTSSSGGSTTSSNTTSSSTSSTSSSTTSSKSSTTTGGSTTKTTGNAGASGSASKADGSEAASDNTANAESGSAASVALGIAALAGAALVVTKRR